MKINGSQTITGMYIYKPEHKYTKNDFVISDGVIYICKEEVMGEDPETSDSFSVYLGEKGRAITLSEYKKFLDELPPSPYLEDRGKAFEEYIEFLEKSEGANKYITVGMLQAIMSYYLLGPTGKGIIGDYIYYDPTGMRVSLKEGTTGGFTNPDTVISDIMFHPDINNAILRVSRFLPEINGCVGFEGISEYSGEDMKSVILRQYTYTQEETNERIRLQELIDPVDGVIWYRSGNMDTKLQTSSGTWKCSVVNSRVLKSKVENLIGIYNSRLKVLKSLETHLKSNFRYRKLEVSGYRPTYISYRKIEEEPDPELTLTISEMNDEGLIRNYQTTINLEDRTETGEIPSYLVGGSYRIDTISGENGYSLRLYDRSTGLTPENAWFSDAFYREYYGLS